MWHIHILKFTEPISHDGAFPWTHVDSLAVWEGSRMILHRVNPYSASAIEHIQSAYYGRPVTPREARLGVNPMWFAYPPQTAFTCVWLALLPWKVASLLTFLASAVLIVSGARSWLRAVGKCDLLILACVMASWPALWGIRLENLSMIVIPTIFIAATLYLRGRLIPAALLMAAVTMKPQLCWLLIVWMLADSLTRRKWRFAASFVGSVVILAALSEIWLPGCFSAWLGALSEYRASTHVAIAMLPVALAACALAIPALYQLRCDGATSIALVLAANVTLCPSDPWVVYNYLLLLPSCLLILRQKGIFDLIAKGFLVLEYLFPVAAGLGDIAVSGRVSYFGAPGLNLLLPASLVMAVSVRHLKVRIAPPHHPVAVFPTAIEAVIFDCADAVSTPSQGAAPLDSPAPKEA